MTENTKKISSSQQLVCTCGWIYKSHYCYGGDCEGCKGVGIPICPPVGIRRELIEQCPNCMQYLK
jgi:hypothetical protein